jgi:hypothetical protein
MCTLQMNLSGLEMKFDPDIGHLASLTTNTVRYVVRKVTQITTQAPSSEKHTFMGAHAATSSGIKRMFTKPPLIPRASNSNLRAVKFNEAGLPPLSENASPELDSANSPELKLVLHLS